MTSKLSSVSRDCNSLSVNLFIAMMILLLPNFDWSLSTVSMFPCFNTIFNFSGEIWEISSGVMMVKPCVNFDIDTLLTISTRSATCNSLKAVSTFPNGTLDNKLGSDWPVCFFQPHLLCLIIVNRTYKTSYFLRLFISSIIIKLKTNNKNKPTYSIGISVTSNKTSAFTLHLQR